MDLRERVTLNGRQYWAFVDRVKRQIVLQGHVNIALTDTIEVSEMTGTIYVVEHDERNTVVTLEG